MMCFEYLLLVKYIVRYLLSNFWGLHTLKGTTLSGGTFEAEHPER